MSGYGPFSWSYGLSVLNTVAEPTWYYRRTPRSLTGADGTQTKPEEVKWDINNNKDDPRARLPVFTYIAWAVLRILLCIDVALINELIGTYVLSGIRYTGFGFQTHLDPWAQAFIGAVGGSISAVFVFVFDAATSKPEKRERWPLIDPNAAVPADGLYKNLNGDLTTNKQRGDPKDAKNYTEGGPITLVKLRTHALMRIVLWLITSVTAGTAGVALWAVKEDNAEDRLGDRIVTGIYIHLIGTGVTTVVPSIVQLLSLLGMMGRGMRSSDR